MQKLIFGAMPEGASPQTHIPAGPWCFCGQEAIFPGWDDKFSFPADPFKNGEKMRLYAASANAEVNRLVSVFGRRLNKEHGINYSRTFWEMALGPWLILAVHTLAERQKRVLNLVECYREFALEIPLLPADCPFSFNNSLEFMQYGVQDVTFNHYVFSRIIEGFQKTAHAPAPGQPESELQPPGEETAAPLSGPESRCGNDSGGCPGGHTGNSSVNHPARWPEHWQTSALPPTSLFRADSTPSPGGWKIKIRKFLRDLPFPRYKGFSLWQALYLSHVLSRKKTDRKNQTIPLSEYGTTPLEWVFPAENLLWQLLPKDILKARLCSIPRCEGEIYGMTPAVSQDDAYRLRLAALLEGGARLFSVQHGANYGNLKSMGGSFFEYRQHAFFTWGWKKHENFPCNAEVLPHPLMCKIYEKHREETPSLVMVGSAMSAFLYRLKSRPQSHQLLAYRKNKLRFIESLSPKVKDALLYRPYFAAKGALLDAEYVRAGFPGLKLCTGDLAGHLMKCRLLVLDHYGTTLHQAMAANIPLVAFWNRAEWAMESETGAVLDVLQQAGILCTNAEEAARRVNDIWNDVQGWWGATERQNARSLWVERYALSGPGATGEKRLTKLWAKAMAEL